MAEKKKNRQRSATQEHHVSYKPEIKYKVYKKEHWLLTQLGRFNPISKGLIKSLRHWIKENKNKAIKL